MIRIYADFNSVDESGHVRLSTVGSLKDIAALTLSQNQRVLLYQTNELEVEAELTFDASRNIWLGLPDWKTLKHYD